MFVALYLLAALPVLAGLFYLLAVARVWRTNRMLAVVMLVFSPAGLYALVRYWSEKEGNIRVPMFAALGALALWWGLIVWGASHVPDVRDNEAAFAEASEEPAAGADRSLDDKLHFSIALVNLPYRNGQVEIATAHAAIDVPAHFHFVERASLLGLYADGDNGPAEKSLGWLVHESVNLGDENAWYIDVEWIGDGYVAENDFATHASDALLADAQRATSQLSTQQGDVYDFRLARYAEAPALDAAGHSATWVEELVYAGQPEHRLDCYAAKLGRGGALMYSINDVAIQRRELCLRSVRLAAGRTQFAGGQAYADHSGLFDHKAKYDLAALVTGTFAQKR
jgi:uncharacterized membrane-anchored protein